MKNNSNNLHKCIIRCSHTIVNLDNANLAQLRRGYENPHSRPAFWRFSANATFPKKTLSEMQQYALFQIMAILVGTHKESYRDGKQHLHDYNFAHAFGRLLAQHEYSESRFLTLLGARNNNRASLLIRAIRYLKTKGAQQVNLCQLGDFLSQQNDDTICKNMASDYYRYHAPQQENNDNKENKEK